jgi:hypothetical protein
MHAKRFRAAAVFCSWHKSHIDLLRRTIIGSTNAPWHALSAARLWWRHFAKQHPVTVNALEWTGSGALAFGLVVGTLIANAQWNSFRRRTATGRLFCAFHCLIALPPGWPLIDAAHEFARAAAVKPLLRRHRIGPDMGTVLDSANHGRKVLFEIHEVFPAE